MTGRSAEPAARRVHVVRAEVVVMLTRRAFLSEATKATVTLLITPLAVASCSSSSSDGTTTTTTNPTEPGCDGIAATSTVVQGHTHAVCVEATLLTSPPADGVTITTTTANGHAHAIVLSSDDLAAVQSGRTASVTTTIASGHVHGFAIRRAV